ncbi:unnamed protein product [Dicrocoelium dendriticum]|nr:unnamed protein product [Dicrocoelium dendriticum]
MQFNIKDSNPIDFLAALESILKSYNIAPEAQQNVRHRIVPALSHKAETKIFNAAERNALENLKKDKIIVILPADKERLTVVMDKSDYMTKAQHLLSDTNTYQPIKEDPTKRLEGNIRRALHKLEQMGKITKSEHKRMRPQDSVIPRFYGLPKVHKSGVPLRPIVSLHGVPNYRLEKELWRRLKHVIAGSEHSIN